jgi:catechol 2,3-dioxygenase-like lactoylglutathione lyase family enzyme
VSAGVHHVELWVPDLAGARGRWAWLFTLLGWKPFQEWPHGQSWRAPDGSYVVLEESPDLVRGPYERRAVGLNHLALTADRYTVDVVAAKGPAHGWTLLFPDRHPRAGGPDTYAAYLVDADGFEIEISAV